MWATASLIKSVGCDNVHLTCASTDVSYVMQSYTDGGVDLRPAKECIKKKCGQVVPSSQPSKVPQTASELHAQYSLIFRTGNRNSASHLWSTYILERADKVSLSVFLALAASYCAVSGSPVRTNDHQLYAVSLPLVQGGSTIRGFMYFCCWPCGCDTKDHIKIDAKSISTIDGTHTFYVAVIGDPCKDPSFTTPTQAPELQCEGTKLKGATFSDNGHVILSLFFTSKGSHGVAASTAVVSSVQVQTMTQDKHDVDGSQM